MVTSRRLSAFITSVALTLLIEILIAIYWSPNTFAQTSDAQRATTPVVAKTGERNQHRPLRTVYSETAPDSTLPALYIVQLNDPPLATYAGDLADLAATSPRVTGTRKLDMRSAAAVNYRAYLASEQNDFLRRAQRMLGRTISVIYHYEVAFNGLSVVLTPPEAAKLVGLSGVHTIQRDRLRQKTTDTSPGFVGAPGIWNGTATGSLPGTQGEGVIVGVIDSGIWPEHPSFADDGSYPQPPVTWQGECTPPSDDSTPYICNNKLIGIQYFLNGYVALLGNYDGLFFSGRDDDGHGTHTASTAAGNANVAATIYGIDRGRVAGMAPRAHVAAYKGLGPRGGFGSDLVAAIDKAVADGVDVINYSVGSDVAADPWIDADALAYLAALEANVFVATSAGNDGPGPSTVGSPANAPWVTSVGASYFNRLFLSEVTLTASGGVTLTGLYGATSTPGVTDFHLVSAVGITDTTGSTAGFCEAPFPAGTFLAGDAVLCLRRGQVATWALGNFVSDGGAGALLLYNNETNYDLNSYLHLLPTVVMLHEAGAQIEQFLADHATETVNVSFTQGTPVVAPDARVPVDTVVGFSARGPNINEMTNAFINVIKPDMTAPGIHVLAGAAPEHITLVGATIDHFGAQGQLFQVIQGTSMSSPHVAGAAALLRALHPEWSAGEVRSALMTTARYSGQQARNGRGDHPATPFDLGAGYIDLNVAGRAGLLLDESGAAYRAADPFAGGEPVALNLPSLTNARCVTICVFTRTVQSALTSAVGWTISASVPPTVSVEVEPAEFSLPAGGSQVITITADISAVRYSDWSYGQLLLTPHNLAVPPAHFPLAVRATAGELPTAIAIATRRDAGVRLIENIRTVDVSELALTIYSAQPQPISAAVAADPTRGDPYDLAAGGVYTSLVAVDATAKRFVVEILASTAPDLDLFVGLDTNSNGQPDAGEELCQSALSSWNEYCAFPPVGSDVQPGNYWVLIQNYTAAQTPQDQFSFATTIIDESSTTDILTATGPNSAVAGEPFSIQINWDLPGLRAGDHRFGVLVFKDAAADVVLAETDVDLTRLADDVTKTASFAGLVPAPGGFVTYTLAITPEMTTAASVRYALTDTLPAGMTYVPGSGTIPPLVDGNQLRWTLDAPTAPVVSTSVNYVAQIDGALLPPADLVNTLEHVADLVGARPAVISHTLSLPAVLLGATLDGPAAVFPGQDISYTLTVSNAGFAVAPNVIANVGLPVGTVHVAGGELMSDTIHVVLGDLAGRTSTSVTLVVRPLGGGLDEAMVTAASAGAQPAIIGGVPAAPGAWPWQVALVFASGSDPFSAQFCGGSLLSANWVLTAAHCVNGARPEQIDVIVGIQQLSANDGQRIAASQLIVHPGFTPALAYPSADIALIRLAEPAQLKGEIGMAGSVLPVKLARTTQPELVTHGILATVTGWGDRSNGLGDYADELQQVSLPLVTRTVCAAAYQVIDPSGGPIGPGILCAGFAEGGKDACYGDSGGPLVVRANTGVWHQVGIVSSGYQCALPAAYGTYTDVPYFASWVFGDGTNTYVSKAVSVADAAGHTAGNGDAVIVTVVREETVLLPLVSSEP